MENNLPEKFLVVVLVFDMSFCQEEISNRTLSVMVGSIVVSVLVNILLILGCKGTRWRRIMVLPWLLFYGAGIVTCIWSHLYYTSLCWREEKVVSIRVII